MLDFIKNLLIAGIVLFAANQQPAVTPLVINELMASNSSTIQDPQGEYDDWIEIYNPSSQPVDIGRWFLTDDLGDPTKWQFPAGTTISSHGYLLVWADGDTETAGLHVGFSLSADGEELGLFDADGTLVDSVVFDSHLSDISFGRWPDGTDTWQYMGTPSPKAANRQGYLGVVSDVDLSPNRGFYNAPIDVTLTTDTAGAEIWYTLDANIPHMQSAGSQGTVSWTGRRYTVPIRLSRTTCIRAVVVKPGWKDSSVTSHTYIFLDDVIRQSANPAGFPTSWGGRTADYAMDQRVVEDPAYRNEIKDDLKSTPSVCIVIPNADFFGSGGIYANATATGDQWERAASMEWIDPNTGENFGINAGLRIHGGPYGRQGNPKNALRVIFRAEYGLSRLEYPLFPDTDVKTFNTLALRSIWNYSWTGHSGMSGPRHADYLRDVFARDTVRDMGHLTPYGRPVQLYINGLYWGLYIMTERPDEHFVADHLGGDKEDYDVLEAPSGMGVSTTMEVISGGEQARQEWNTLFALADDNLASSEAYQAIQDYVDIPNMIDYMLMIYYTGSRDAPVFLGDSYTPRNFYAVRHREPAGPFSFVPWDTEWALEEPTVNRVGVVGVLNPHYLMDKLAANPEFKMLLADQIHRHFYNGGALTREQTTQRYMNRADEIRGAIVGESARWGDEPRPSQPYTRADWEAEVNRLVTQYFSGRTETVLAQLRNRGWYPLTEAPAFRINGNDQHGGHILSTDSLSMTASKGVIYYTLDGSDPRLQGTSAGTASGTNLVTGNAAKKVLVPAAAISNDWISNPRFNESSWINGTGGVGYERSSGYETLISIDVGAQMYSKLTSCYIRIPFTVNSNPSNFNSLMLNMRYDDGFIAYINGVEVQRALFTGTPAWNSTTSTNHEADGGAESFDISTYLGTLYQGGNLMAIHGLNVSTTSSDFLILAELVASQGSTTTSSSVVSPAAIRYTGPITLTKSTHLKSRVLDSSTWSALNEVTFAVGPVAENLRITEIMYHPKEGFADPNEEYIELKNIGTESINLNLVRFTDGIDFTFGDIALAPGRYTVVVKDTGAFTARYGTTMNIAGQYSGSLSNAGERIRLEDAAGQVIQDFEYSDGWWDITDGEGFSLRIIDPTSTDPNSWGQKNSWQASLPSPGM
jgi:hypothetical protein